MNSNTTIPFRRAGGPLEPSGRLWPDGTFSIGYAPCGGAEKEDTMREWVDKALGHLGSSLPSNSHRDDEVPRPKRGQKGITPYGKKVLKNAVWRMQRLYGKRSLSFVTLTLPSITFEESWYVSSCWSEILRVFYQKVVRELERCGLPRVYAGCTELQPKRCNREEHPALHIHFVIVGRWRSRGKWALSPADFRRLWMESVSPYLQNEYSWEACENVQMVKKDVSAYLGKYLSKGVCVDRVPLPDERGWSLPTCWYNVSLGLRQWVTDSIRRHPTLIEALELAARGGYLEQYCHYYHAGELEYGTGPGPHYFVGKLEGDAMKSIIDVWWASVDVTSRQRVYNANRLANRRD